MLRTKSKLAQIQAENQKLVAATNMASSQSDREWLRKAIEDGSIRFYSPKDFVDVRYIGGGGYGAVFKAKVKSLGRTVAYKILHSQNGDEMIDNFVKEVGNINNDFIFKFIIIIVALLKPSETIRIA